MNEAIYLFLGAVIAGLVGLVTQYINRLLEEKRTRERLVKALLPEVQANQFQIGPFYFLNPEGDPIPSNVKFDRTIYSSLADKLGILNNLNEIVDYYTQINVVEDAYTKLDNQDRFVISTGKKEMIEELKKKGNVGAFFNNVQMAYEFGDMLEGSLQVIMASRKNKRDTYLIKAK